MFKKFSIFIFCLLFVFVFQGFCQAPCVDTPTENETDCGILFDYIPGDVYMHTAPWINSNFWIVSNRITGLGQDLTNKYNEITNRLVGLGNVLTNTIENVASISNHLNEVHAIVSNHEERIIGLGTALTNFEQEVEASTNDIRRIIQENYETLETNIKTNIEAVNSNLATQGQMLTNLTSEFKTFTTNVWDAFESTTNRMNSLQGGINTNAGNIKTNYEYMTNALWSVTNRLDENAGNIFTNNLRIGAIETNISTNFPNIHGRLETIEENVSTNFPELTSRIETIETNISTNLPQIHTDIEAVSNYTKNVEGQVSTNYEYMTNALQSASNRMDEIETTVQNNFTYTTDALNSATNRMDGIDETIQTFQEQTSSALESATNRMDSIQEIIETNYEFTTNTLTNIIISVENNASDIADLTTSVSDILTNTIPEITNNIGISVIGATSADADYTTNKNISTMKFDKDSGFTVVTNDMGEKAVQISLGSAWTTLIPDIEQINPETDEPYPNLRPSGEETLNVKVIVTNETGTFWDYSNTNKNEKTFYIGIGQEIAGDIPYDKVYTTENITVQGIPYPLGKYTNGSVIAENTSLKTIFGNMFSKAVPPVYTNPTLAVTANGFTKGQTYEYGTQFSGKSLTASVTRWDAGDIEWYAYFTNNYIIQSNDTALIVNTCNLDGFQSLGTLTFKTVVSYKEGPTKKDSYGDDYPTGKVLAGTLTDTFSIYGSRYMFWGLKSSQYPVEIASRDAIISLGNSNFVSKVTTLDIVLTKGTHQVIFAVPQNISVSSIRFKNNFVDEDISENVVTSLVPNVYCLNNYSGDNDGGKTYRVYSYFSPQETLENNTDHIIVRIP